MKCDSTLIHQWLTNVPDGLDCIPDDPVLRNLIPSTLDLKERNTGNRKTSTLLALDQPSLIIDCAPGSKTPDVRQGQESHTLLERVQSLGRSAVKRKAHHEFDRQPRHKTREDHYEYKGGGTEQQQQDSSDRTKKRQKKCRKHTLNDTFHAANVARERLTLPEKMTLGIFSKGKASSPLRLRDSVPDPINLTTSLLKKQDITEPSSLTSRTATGERRGSGQQRRIPNYRLSDSFNSLELKSIKTQQGTITEHMKGKGIDTPSAHKPPQDSPHNDIVRSPSYHSPVNTPDRGTYPEEHVERNANVSISPTPHTWSETDPEKTKREYSIHGTLLKSLFVGLSRYGIQDPCPKLDHEKTYCSLDDLKWLLETRKASWLSRTNENHQDILRSPGITSQQGIRVNTNLSVAGNKSSGQNTPTRGPANPEMIQRMELSFPNLVIPAERKSSSVISQNEHGKPESTPDSSQDLQPLQDIIDPAGTSKDINDPAPLTKPSLDETNWVAILSPQIQREPSGSPSVADSLGSCLREWVVAGESALQVNRHERAPDDSNLPQYSEEHGIKDQSKPIHNGLHPDTAHVTNDTFLPVNFWRPNKLY
ncbi:uncharacterized protein N7483_007197 [Penicillium malachiteum]|uniref:uncharacterized protein n=1 Tax=Penicillium malachiteum TaxID=1324776 RepID=UPI00254772D9|nr:uncharacterized protein N7483_007197 [Penicillium malachiteum]KAJ5725840.1 hypothetical protein N7483_007197 [Penicillium malachiteum]